MKRREKSFYKSKIVISYCNERRENVNSEKRKSLIQSKRNMQTEKMK